MLIGAAALRSIDAAIAAEGMTGNPVVDLAVASGTAPYRATDIERPDEVVTRSRREAVRRIVDAVVAPPIGRPSATWPTPALADASRSAVAPGVMPCRHPASMVAAS